MGSRSVRGLLPGEDPRERMREEALRRGLDYADEMLPAVPRSMIDSVSRGVVAAGGSAVYVEGPRPEWSRPKGRLDGEIPGEPARFDRMYRIGGVGLYVDVMAGDPVEAWRVGTDAGWAEQRRRGSLCRANGAAYLYVDPNLPDDEIAEGVRSAVAMVKPKK